MTEQPSHYRAGIAALQFLTVLPTPALPSPVSARELGLSLLWYPVVGLLIGALLVISGSLLSLPVSVQAVLVVLVWAVVTGALHLDGLADCADALLGGLGDRERTLSLLKDPLCGSMAVVALVLALLSKWLLVEALLEVGHVHWLLIVPALARFALLPFFATTPYVRSGGLGAALAAHYPRTAANRLVMAAGLFALLFAGVWVTFVVSIGMAITFFAVRRLAMTRLGGFTGDVAGALVELMELAVMLALLSVLGAA